MGAGLFSALPPGKGIKMVFKSKHRTYSIVLPNTGKPIHFANWIYSTDNKAEIDFLLNCGVGEIEPLSPATKKPEPMPNVEEDIAGPPPDIPKKPAGRPKRRGRGR